MTSYFCSAFTLSSLLLLGYFPSFSFSQKNIYPELQRRIDQLVIDHYLPHANISSLGLAIVQNDGELLYSTGYGWADIERRIPVENSTQFLIGGITKSLTSLIVAKVLHEKFPHLGEGVLDVPIRKLVPEASFTLSDKFRSEQTTFRDLLAHRMCLYTGSLAIAAGAMRTREELAYASRFEEEFCGFRSQFVYNSRMYVLVGELIELVGRSTYQNLVQELLNELGMSGSALVKESDDFFRMPFRAMPYYVRGSEIYSMNTNLIKRFALADAAAGLFSTPIDMASYMRLHLNLGRLNGRQIVPKEVMEWLRSPSMIVSQFEGSQRNNHKVGIGSAYGLGLYIGSYDGWERIHHSGFQAPYTTLMSFYPEKNLGIFSATNMGSAPVKADQNALHSMIFDLLNNGNGDPSKTTRLFRRRQNDIKNEGWEKAETKFSRILNEVRENGRTHRREVNIAGKYNSASLGEAVISENFNEGSRQNQYYLQYGIWFKGWLEQVEDGTHIYRFIFDTDAGQDDFAVGMWNSMRYAYILDKNLYITHLAAQNYSTSKFTLVKSERGGYE